MELIKIVLLLCIFGLTKSDGQVSIGHHLQWKNAAPLKEDILNEFKSTTTVFIVRKEDDLNLFEEQLKKVWTITPLEVIRLSDIGDYLNKVEYSIFEIQGSSVTTTSGNNRDNTCAYISLELYINQLGKKGKIAPYPLAKMELHPDIETLLGVSENTSFSDNTYNEATLYNWNEISVINFVKQVNDHIRKKKGQAFYARSQNDKQLKKLKRKTLYVPEYVLRKYNALKKTEGELYKVEDLFSNYSYKYEVVSNKDLLEMYLNSESSFYYLTSVKSCSKVLINVVNGKTGAIIYSDYPKLLSYNIKPKDLKELGKKIGKIK